MKVDTNQIVLEQIMKRLDEGKVSLVDFLRSIKYARQHKAHRQDDYPAQFADYSPQARAGKKSNAEDRCLVRSGN
jgi:hypothetical protein